MDETKGLIKEILMIGYLMSLGTIDEGGVWVSDIVYVYDEHFNLYWISQLSSRHSKAIEKIPEVAVTITISQKGEDNKGLQISGVAEKINGNSLELMKQHLEKRGHSKVNPEASFEAHQPLKDEQSWYKLTPKKIELIYERLYGFNKQVLEL